MNLEELQSVQSKERQATSLQSLRSTFYQDAGSFVRDLERERDRAAERADDPFSSPEVRQLTDDVETAKRTVEAIYERRVGKVVKMASIAAADMPTDQEGLTEEEAALFDTLVGNIEDNRAHVLEEVLEGEGGPSVTTSSGDGASSADSSSSDQGPESERDESVPPEAPPDEPISPEESSEDEVSAADLMGSDEESEETDGGERTEGPRFSSDERSESAGGESVPARDRPGQDSPSDDDSGTESDTSDGDVESVERTTVRITQDVGEIFGVDERSYELSSEDVVALPTANAEPLVEREAAEKLE